MPRNVNPEEDPEAPPESPPNEPWAPPTTHYAPGQNPNHIAAPSRWNEGLWDNPYNLADDTTPQDPMARLGGPSNGGYDDINPNGPPATPAAAAAGAGGNGRVPRHLTIYGGRGYNEDGSLRDKLEAAASGGGSSGGGGGGSSSTSGGATGSVPDFGGMNDKILAQLEAMMSGEDAPFGEEQQARLRDKLFAAVQGRAGANKTALNRDLARRGIFRSGIAAGQSGEIDRQALAEYGQGVNAIGIEAARANYEARVGALDRSQRWLDSQRDYLLRHESNEVALKTGMAQVNLGYARIAAEERMLERQLAARGGGGGGGGDSEFYSLLNQLLAPNPYGSGGAPYTPSYTQGGGYR